MTDDARNRVAPDTPPVFLHLQRARALFLSTPQPRIRLFVQAVNPQQLGLVRMVAFAAFAFCYSPFSLSRSSLHASPFLSLEIYTNTSTTLELRGAATSFCYSRFASASKILIRWPSWEEMRRAQLESL